jgi:hypothetical protein
MTEYLIVEILRVVAAMNAEHDRPCGIIDIFPKVRAPRPLIVKAVYKAHTDGHLEPDALPLRGYWITTSGGDLIDAYRPGPVNPELLATASDVEGP